MTAVGVVMGQGQGSETSLLLAAAGQAATQLVESVSGAQRLDVNTITTRRRNHE